MAIENELNNVIKSSEDYHATEVHFMNKRNDLTEYELSEWEKARRKYQSDLIQAIDILVQELKTL